MGMLIQDFGDIFAASVHIAAQTGAQKGLRIRQRSVNVTVRYDHRAPWTLLRKWDEKLSDTRDITLKPWWHYGRW